MNSNPRPNSGPRSSGRGSRGARSNSSASKGSRTTANSTRIPKLLVSHSNINNFDGNFDARQTSSPNQNNNFGRQKSKTSRIQSRPTGPKQKGSEQPATRTGGSFGPQPHPNSSFSTLDGIRSDSTRFRPATSLRLPPGLHRLLPAIDELRAAEPKNGRGSAGDADHKPQTPTDRPKTLKTTGLQTLHAAEAGPEARGADRPTLMVGEAAVRVVLVLVVLETVGLVAVGSRERSLCHLA